MPIRVVLVDDDRKTRETLIDLLERESDIEVIAEAADGQSGLLLVRDVNPDVVVMDVFMPQINGIQATGSIASQHPGTKVILLSMGYEKVFVDYLFRIGASGFILKTNVSSELASAIHKVMEGRTFRGKGVGYYLGEV